MTATVKVCAAPDCVQPIQQREGEAPSAFASRKYCSSACVAAGRSRYPRPPTGAVKVCARAGCGVVRHPEGLTPQAWARWKYCCKPCADADRSRGLIGLVKACAAPGCRVEIRPKKGRGRRVWEKQQFCSHECASGGSSSVVPRPAAPRKVAAPPVIAAVPAVVPAVVPSAPWKPESLGGIPRPVQPQPPRRPGRQGYEATSLPPPAVLAVEVVARARRAVLHQAEQGVPHGVVAELLHMLDLVPADRLVRPDWWIGAAWHVAHRVAPDGMTACGRDMSGARIAPAPDGSKRCASCVAELERASREAS